MRWVDALMTEKNRKEEQDVAGRLWHDNIDLSIVGPDNSVIFMSPSLCGQTDTQLAVIMPTSSPPRRALTSLTKREDRRRNSAFVVQIAF
jgi:hypothetical protein